MEIRRCVHCVYYFPTSTKGTGQCRKAPSGVFGQLNVDSGHWCGDGKFMSTKFNEAGSRRLYNLEGETIGFYHFPIDE